MTLLPKAIFNAVPALALTASLGLSSVAGAQTPEPGRWELEVALKGAPIKDPAPSQHCLNAEAMGTTPERALLDAAMRSLPSSGASGAQCVLTGLARDGSKSFWQARCNGPRGPMAGSGSAVLSAQSATLVQSFEVETPLGLQTLRQTIRAQRTGACK